MTHKPQKQLGVRVARDLADLLARYADAAGEAQGAVVEAAVGVYLARRIQEAREEAARGGRGQWAERQARVAQVPLLPELLDHLLTWAPVELNHDGTPRVAAQVAAGGDEHGGT